LGRNIIVETIKKYGIEVTGWTLTIGLLGYILLYQSFGAFLINLLVAILMGMSTYYFGDLMPIVGYFMQSKRRSSDDDDAGGK
jgi:hypothetical protein